MFTSAYLPDTKRIEQCLSIDRDFPIRPQGASSKYVLCSSPRSGSSLIASMLYASGVAGYPLEYLNDQWIDVQIGSNSASKADFNVDRYLAEWEKRRTSPNGVFGIKLHYYQMRRVWRGSDQEAARLLGAYDQRILLIRRDKIAQAVSLYRALTSQIWSSVDLKSLGENNSENRKRTVNFDAARIAELMAFSIKEEERWRNFMKTYNLPFAELCYEDFVNDYVGQSLRLLQLLGIDREADAIPPPQLARQSQDNDPMITQFKLAIGLRSGSNNP